MVKRNKKPKRKVSRKKPSKGLEDIFNFDPSESVEKQIKDEFSILDQLHPKKKRKKK